MQSSTLGIVEFGEHREILRRMLLVGDPGRQYHYPSFATALINGRNKIERRIVTMPTLMRVKGHHAYGFATAPASHCAAPAQMCIEACRMLRAE